jgi:hypothetical protein
MLKRLARWIGLPLLLVCCIDGCIATVGAESLQSQNYSIDESSVGVSNLNLSNSNSYQATTATGSLSIGDATSSSYQVETGTKTTPYPTLSFSIPGGNVNFGNFSSTGPTVTTETFSVLNYTSYGYVVQIVGNPPTSDTHTIQAMTETGPSQIGIEQFGINLVANTSPSNFGSNPDNSQFGFGSIAGNYSTSNQFRFVSGETIALAPRSSGLTNYTISYLVNVSALTPGGQYSCNQVLIATGTY